MGQGAFSDSSGTCNLGGQRYAALTDTLINNTRACLRITSIAVAPTVVAEFMG